MRKLDRRSVLSAFGSIAAFVPALLRAQPRPAWHGFVVESGTRSRSDYAVGILVCSRPTSHVTALRSLRSRAWFIPNTRRGYFRPLRYSSTDRRRVDFARLSLQNFRDQSDMFVSQVRHGGRWPDNASGRDAVQLQMYTRTVAQIPQAQRTNLTLHVIRRTRNGRDLQLLDTVRRRFGSQISISEDGQNYKDLMGLASLIVGSIGAEQTRAIRSPTKLLLQADLRRSLNVPNLTSAQLSQTRKVKATIA